MATIATPDTPYDPTAQPPRRLPLWAWALIAAALIASAAVAIFGSALVAFGSTEETTIADAVSLGEEELTFQRFTTAWTTGDWAAMSEFASPEAQLVAEEWFASDMTVVAVTDFVPAGTELEVTTMDTEPARLFIAVVGEVDGRFVVTDLVYAGDAG